MLRTFVFSFVAMLSGVCLAAINPLTSGGTGIVQIGGLPYTCSTTTGGQPVSAALHFTGLTGALSLQTAANDTTAYIVQSNAGGAGSITDGNITNTTTLQGFIICGKTN